MSISMHLLFVTLGSIVLFGCQQINSGVDVQKWTELRIESRPQGWGYAYKTVRPDGSITGGHMSGGEKAPRVFESKSQVDSRDISKLRALVAKISAETIKEEPSPPDQKREGYTSVTVIFGEDNVMTSFAKWEELFQSDTIQAIWDIVSKYEEGAW
ncbi:MAG: hypothetical protein GY707_08995 [Desulfobacteraceae bacterium]|nr:hypothetical protein [Desulfobacteraceae bacterium]